MTKLLIGFWIILAATVLVSVTVFLLRLNQTTINLIGYFLVAGIFIFIAGVSILFGNEVCQRFRATKARADQEIAKANAANYIEYKDGFGMSHLLNLKTSRVENLSTYPGSHHNGHWEEPPQSAMLAWFALVSRSKDINKEVAQASQITIEQKPNLLDLIDQYPHCQIYGGTGSGKTSLLRTIAYHRQNKGHQVLILDSTEHPSKWQGLNRVRDRNKQNEAISKLFSIYKQNEAALSSGRATEQDFIQITVLSDEWTDIVFENDLAKQFIREQVRKVRKFGIHLVFATQTDLASDLGLDGAYKTTNSFLKVETKKLPDGQYISIAKLGYQKLGEFLTPPPPYLPALLPSGYNAPTLETVKVIKQSIPELDQEVINMFLNGANYREITSKVWGQVGTFYNNKIDQILKKYSVNK